MDKATPTRSSRPRFGSRDSGTISETAITPNSTIGTLIRKTEPHQKCSSSAPPTTGPIATPRPTDPAQTPIALPRSRGSKTFEMIDKVAGRTAAPPMPISARAPISWTGVCAYADASEARPNMTRPASSMRRRPIRSPSTPQVNSSPAKTRVYELIAHSSWLWLAPRPCTGSAMVRSATFSTVLSRTTTSRLMTNTARIRQRCGWPRLAGADGAADEVDVTDMRIPHVFDTDLNRYACGSYSNQTLLRIESDTEPFRNEISVSWATPRPG